MKQSAAFTRSLRWAWAGVRAAVRRERNMKIHLVFTAAVTAAGLLFGISKTEWLVCLIFFALVLGAELMNTAVESAVDLISPEKHPLAKLAKDAAAGAVLVCAFFAAVAGCLIFVPHIWALFVS
ncbi:MAG: diacylglycerol kinase family protein [Eubacteriales bacterium]|nr:diacylglycerol kinase family protein [Eubacteriales bacterium]